VSEGDKLLISADRTPNVRGALLTGLATKLPTKTLSDLGAAIDSGKVKAILCLGEDLLAAGLSSTQLAKVAVVYLGTQANPTSAIARVVFPTLTVFEKSGTFVNQQFRIQKFFKAFPPAVSALDDLVVLTSLITAVGGGAVPSEISGLWKLLASEVPALGTITFANLPETGLLIDGSQWAGLSFPEGETLHYKPTAPVPVAENTTPPPSPKAGTPT
jgi:NADH-quinone oxidoreductase subunit G